MKKSSILRNKTIVIGCGRLGSQIANKCSKEGKNLIVVDPDKDSFDRLSAEFTGYTVAGDATILEVLDMAYVGTANEIIITTGNDNVNVLVAYIAKKKYDIPNIYVRLDDPHQEILLKGMGIMTIYPNELSYDKFNLLRGGRK